MRNSGYTAAPFIKVGLAHAQSSVVNSGAVLRERGQLTADMRREGGVGTIK